MPLKVRTLLGKPLRKRLIKGRMVELDPMSICTLIFASCGGVEKPWSIFICTVLLNSFRTSSGEAIIFLRGNGNGSCELVLIHEVLVSRQK